MSLSVRGRVAASSPVAEILLTARRHVGGSAATEQEQKSEEQQKLVKRWWRLEGECFFFSLSAHRTFGKSLWSFQVISSLFRVISVKRLKMLQTLRKQPPPNPPQPGQARHSHCGGTRLWKIVSCMKETNQDERHSSDGSGEMALNEICVFLCRFYFSVPQPSARSAVPISGRLSDAQRGKKKHQQKRSTTVQTVTGLAPPTETFGGCKCEIALWFAHVITLAHRWGRQHGVTEKKKIARSETHKEATQDQQKIINRLKTTLLLDKASFQN